jgi:hypothetical protein
VLACRHLGELSEAVLSFRITARIYAASKLRYIFNRERPCVSAILWHSIDDTQYSFQKNRTKFSAFVIQHLHLSILSAVQLIWRPIGESRYNLLKASDRALSGSRLDPGVLEGRLTGRDELDWNLAVLYNID